MCSSTSKAQTASKTASARERGDVAADHLPGAQAAEHVLRRLAGELVGLDPDVAVPLRQPGAERAATRADLEDGLDPVEPGERALDQVVAKPGVEGERRCVHAVILESPAVRIVAFGTYRLWEQPRVQVLFEGLREHGHELVECNVPLPVDTAERVRAARQPLRAPLVAARVARAWRDLWRKAKEMPDPDVVLVPYMGQFDVHLARRRFKSKPIVLDHYLFFKDTAIDRGTTFKPELAALDRIDKSAIRAADLVFVDSEGHRELLPEPIRSEAFTVYIGTPNEWFHEPKPRTEGPVRVVFFGIYTPLQGAPVIGEAIRLLDPDPAEVRFTMAGRGQDLARTKELAGDSPAVEWIDWVEREELPALVFEHDICLGIFSPGAKGMRVIPNKVFQGAAAGCAIVTSDSVSQREALGDAARFVEPGDPQALADALRWLIADRDRVWTLRQAAYRRAVEAFAPAAVVEPLHARLQAGVRKRR